MRYEVYSPTDGTARSEKVFSHPNISGHFKISALVAGVLGITTAGCADDKKIDSSPPPVSATSHTLTINDLNPPRAPLVLPFINGLPVRVSQHAHSLPTHCNRDQLPDCSLGNNNTPSNSRLTLNAVDFVDEAFAFIDGNGDLADDHDQRGFVVTNVSGTIHRRQGNCTEHSHVQSGNGCNGGWGNVVELTGRDGQTYISAHCDAFSDEAPEGAFVLRGTPVCRIGSTGNSTGIHLHFDKVIRDPQDSPRERYNSIGIPGYITFKTGNAEPTIETPDSLEDCCNRCAVTPLDRNGNSNPNCKRYISFNRPLQETLQTFISEIQTADTRRMQLQGDMIIDADRSQQQSPLIITHQAVTIEVNGVRTPSLIYLIHTTPSLAGQRNPFLDTAYAYVWNPANQQWENQGWRTQIHTERFKNFDLWDFTNSFLSEQERASFDDGHLPFTQSVQERPNWDSQWELWETTFNVNGESINAYLAVAKQNRGHRFAGLYRNGVWSGWHLM